MANEYGEPWTKRVEKDHPEFDYEGIIDADGYGVGESGYDGNEGTLIEGPLRDRIIACVNACAGIPTEKLTEGTGRILRTILEHIESDEGGLTFSVIDKGMRQICISRVLPDPLCYAESD